MMKVIVSHDVDHLYVSEHLKDLIIPKHIIRSVIDIRNGVIDWRELYLRVKELLGNKWHNISEVMEFDFTKSIPSTFFIGVSNGLGLSYNLHHAEEWIKKIDKAGFDVGVHGIAYSDFLEMEKEYDTMKSILGRSDFGIRMHYLRTDSDTVNKLSRLGYKFDSSETDRLHSYKVGNMSEYPLHIMDGRMMLSDKKWQTDDLDAIKSKTINKIKEMRARNVKYMTLLFHDRYFNKTFSAWKDWYEYTIEYLIEEGVEFISYGEAIREEELNFKLES